MRTSADEGFVILGFPADDVAGQEPRDDEAIAAVLPRQLRRDVSDVRQDQRLGDEARAPVQGARRARLELQQVPARARRPADPASGARAPTPDDPELVGAIRAELDGTRLLMAAVADLDTARATLLEALREHALILGEVTLCLRAEGELLRRRPAGPAAARGIPRRGRAGGLCRRRPRGRRRRRPRDGRDSRRLLGPCGRVRLTPAGVLRPQGGKAARPPARRRGRGRRGATAFWSSRTP